VEAGGVRRVYKDWGIKRVGEEVLGIGRGFKQKAFEPISREIRGIL